MIKKLFLLLIVAMLNVVAWAATENVISIGTYDKAQTVGELKFTEPVVRVVTMTDEVETANVTSQYNIEYSIFDAETSGTEGTLETVSGVRYRKDETTGTTVKVLGGDVVMGNTPGNVWIEVIATPKSGSGATLRARYEINISAISVDVTFTPVFTDKAGYNGSIEVYTKNTGHSYSKAYALLPKYKLNVAGTTKDVTDEFDVAISYTGSTQMYLSSDKSKIQFDQKMSIPSGDHYGTLTYTFTSKTGQYSTIIKNIYVSLKADSYEAAKKNLELSLTRNHIKQETVSQEPGVNEGYLTTHIYKYGKSDLDGGGDAYHYKTPTPSLLVDGTALPLNVTNGGGGYGDFKLVYKIVSDETYFDDCQFLYSNRTGSIQNPGEPTGIRVDENAYQVAKPGLVKVAVYAVLDEGYYGTNLKAMYNAVKDPANPSEDWVITDDWGGRYVVYAQPQYFYIDVMKRQPTIQLTPDPTNLSFITGDVITMDDRFEISAYKGTDSNGIAGALKWGANDGSGDHFAYQFFISDRNKDHIHIDWYAYAASGDTNTSHPTWDDNGGDIYSFINWHATGYELSQSQALREGDIIKTGNTIQFTADRDFNIATEGDATRNLIGQTITIGGKNILVTPGNIDELVGVKNGDVVTVNEYVLITSGNISSYSSRYLQEGDFEKGITYNSMKGYGNEDWKMTFNTDGDYNIPYTARPWNHVKWDVSAEKTITFNVSTTPEPTELELSYYYQVAMVSQDPFNEPVAKVVTTNGKYDVTKYFTITYSITTENDGSLNGTTGLYEHAATGTTLNPTTGEVHIGNTTGDVVITVHAQRDPTVSYDNPADKTYTIHIISGAGLAKWEVMSECDHSCAVPAEESKRRFETVANGRMHFYGTGAIYGGTVIDGVPGIDMTVGVPAGETSEWAAKETSLTSKVCCKHEGDHSVIITSASNVVLDENGIPTAGAFYKFRPTVNGFLTVDANFKSGHSVVLRSLNSITGEILDEVYYNTSGDDFPGDHEFSKPLLAGQTYYLFDETDGKELRLHGFGYQPAFIMDRSTTKAQSEAPLSASTFLNSLMKNVPELCNGTNSHVAFAVSESPSYSGRATAGGGAGAYLSVESDGKLDPHKMTLDDEGVFKLRVTATVSSSTLAGECTKKTTYYDVQIIDIPTFKIGKYNSSETPAEGTVNYETLESIPGINKLVGYEAETTNIKTAIKMTFGGTSIANYEAVNPQGETVPRTDEWKYSNKYDGGTTVAGHLIEGYNSTDGFDYNLPIDNFEYFTKGANNPVDEEGNQPLLESPISPNNGSNYTYGNGVGYEQDENFHYNTTYRVPSRGTYLKFEPRESGTLIVYLLQEGSCDYQTQGPNDYGLQPVALNKSYQMKWRPLYITDETGKPVEMVNQFGNVSKYLDAGDDLENAGSYTLGLARCNKVEAAIDSECGSHSGVVKRDGCSFDWSQFRGTDADAARLLAAWPAKGQRESIIRLDNGGFALPHKAYVRYAFDVKAGKTYFVFQQGSKFWLGGYSFVPVGFPDNCTYTLSSTPGSYNKNAQTQEKVWNGGATAPGTDSESDITFTWDKSSTMFNSNVENLYVTINDRRNSELTNTSYADRGILKPRTFTAGNWESICLPFSVSESEMKEVFGNDYVLVTCDGVYNDPANGIQDRILFTRHANGYAEAGRPYLVKPSEPGTFKFKNVSIEGAESVTDYNGAVYKVPNPKRFTVGINNEEFIFKGVYMRETMPQGSYFVYNGDEEHPNGLYRYNADAKIGGYRAYFQLQSGRPEAALMSSFSIRDVKFAEADIETGILAINKDGSVTEIPRNAGIYTIDGQKLSDNPLDFNKLPSGIYIVDGKKYVR